MKKSDVVKLIQDALEDLGGKEFCCRPEAELALNIMEKYGMEPPLHQANNGDFVNEWEPEDL